MHVQHNIAALNANNQLKISNRNRAKTSERLSSGYRINRSADDAAGLAISEKMRNQIRGLNQASVNIQHGIALTNVADGAIGEIHSIMGRERELLVQAANDTNDDEVDRRAIEMELEQISEELDRIFESTEFNKIPLFKGKETILAGPAITQNSTAATDTISGIPQTKTEMKWLPKSPVPTDSTSSSEISSTHMRTEYTENETVAANSEPLHISYDRNQIESLIVESTTTRTTTDISYKKIDDADYTSLRKPGDMVGSNGYINVSTVKGNLGLSCAMSRLGVQVDGSLVSLDLYNDSKVSKNTVVSGDKKTATTTYDLGDGLSLTQNIALTGNDDTYSISYSISNTGANSHAVDVRLAFDTMNTQATSKKDGTTAFTLESDFAQIGISASPVDKGVLGNIEDLYYQWGDNVVDGANVSYHTGVGYWWENETVNSGAASQPVGTVTYGPIQLLEDPYEVTTTVTTDIKRETTQDDIITSETYLPKYLDIQAGANSGQIVPIRLFDLSAEKLRIRVPEEVSAYKAGNSLDYVDRVANRMSSIRSYYGAITNRLEHAYEYDTNASENTTAAESLLRDADMAADTVQYSKHTILEQAGTSMLAQSNQVPNGVLNLLQ